MRTVFVYVGHITKHEGLLTSFIWHRNLSTTYFYSIQCCHVNNFLQRIYIISIQRTVKSYKNTLLINQLSINELWQFTLRCKSKDLGLVCLSSTLYIRIYRDCFRLYGMQQYGEHSASGEKTQSIFKCSTNISVANSRNVPTWSRTSSQEVWGALLHGE
jgi:hypothetical protein